MYKSTSKVTPTKGRVIIKVIVSEFNSKNLVLGNYTHENRECYIDAVYDKTSELIVGTKIAIEAHVFAAGSIDGIKNVRSLKAVSDKYKSLTEIEQEEYLDTRPTVQLVEYMSIYENNIVAIINE